MKGHPASEQEAAESHRAPRVEIRVHGIGDHDDWSELGSPALVVSTSDREPVVALPPERTQFPLRLVNWSRTSRKAAGLIWYLALPFTLINTAGHMFGFEDSDRGAIRSRSSDIRVRCMALILTFLAFVWLCALLETVARSIFTELTAKRWASVLLTLSVAVVLVAVMVGRKCSGKTGVSWRSVAMHCTLTVGSWVAAVLVSPVLPKQPAVGTATRFFFTASACGMPEVKDGRRVRPLPIEYSVDIVTMSSVICIGAALLLATWSLFDHRKIYGGGTRGAQAIAFMTAPLLLVGLASLLRLILNNTLAFLERRDLVPGYTGRRADPSNRLILPRLNGDCADQTDYALDLLSAFGLTAAATLGVSIYSTFLWRDWRTRGARHVNDFTESTPRADRRKIQSAQRTHRLITGLGPSLACSSALAGFLWLSVLVILGHLWSTATVSHLPELYLIAVTPVLIILIAISVIKRRHVVTSLLTVAGIATLLGIANNGTTVQWITLIATSAQILSGVAAIVLIAARSTGRVHAVLSSAADVIGFWPAVHHPLAGVSYRDKVVETIHSELSIERESVVLTGHSQGSVLCAWSIASLPSDSSVLSGRDRLALITCGSPLDSLYRQFFPRFFSNSFFDRITERTHGRWVNMWRCTDPIATPLTNGAVSICITDPAKAGDPLLRHGDYWVAPAQRDQVANFLANAKPGDRPHTVS